MNKIIAERLLLLFLTCFGLALRLIYLPSDDAWWDELVTATRALLPLDELWTSLKYQGPSLVSTDCAPPLHHTLIHFSLLLGKNDFFLKLPNALFGTLTIPAVYYLAKRLITGRAAWYAAIFICLSSFHVSYSRDARWYSLFFFTAVSTFSFFLAALESGRLNNWLAFVLFAAAMCYTSYTAAVYLFALCLVFVAWLFVSGPSPTIKKQTAKCFSLSLLAVLVLYSPWISAQINTYFAFHDPNIVRPFSLEKLIGYFRAFIAPHYLTLSYLFIVTLAIVLGGLTEFLAGKRYFQLVALLLWTFLPVLAAHKAKIAFEISPRYIISVFLFMCCMTAAFADGLGQIVARLLGRTKTICSLAVGLTVVVYLSSYSFRFYPGHFFDAQNSYKPFLSWLASNKYTAEYLLYEKSRQHKAIVDWYLPGLYKGQDAFDAPSYKRCMVMKGADRTQPPAPEEIRFDEYAFTRIGLINRSPLVIEPGNDDVFEYVSDFNSFQAYQDASFIDNVSVQTSFKELALYDPTKPGEIAYTFIDPSGGKAKSLTVRITLSLDRVKFIEPDCTFSLAIKDAAGNDHPLMVSTARDFPQGTTTLELEAVLDMASMPNGPLQAVLTFSHGKRAGYISVKQFSFSFRLEPHPLRSPDVVEEYARHIAANAQLTPWSPGTVAIAPPGPYAFDMESPEGRKQYEQFRNAYPKSRPVYALRDKDGRVRREYHDPWLSEPYVTLPEGRAVPVLTSAKGSSPREFASYVLAGRMSFPTIRSENKEWPLLLNTPPGAKVVINAGSKGRLTIRPVFSGHEFTPSTIDRYEGLATLQGQDCLTCTPGKGCSFTYSFQSVFPVETLRVVWHPRLYSDTGGINCVRLLVAEDGKEPREVGRYDGNRTGGWDGPSRIVTTLQLPKPANKVDILFQLTGDGAQVWSNQDIPLVIDAGIDCRTAPVLSFSPSSRLAANGNGGNDFGVFLSNSPIPFFDHVEYLH